MNVLDYRTPGTTQKRLPLWFEDILWFSAFFAAQGIILVLCAAAIYELFVLLHL